MLTRDGEVFLPKLAKLEVSKPSTSVCHNATRLSNSAKPSSDVPDHLRVVRACKSEVSPSTRGGKRSRYRKRWRHPSKRNIEMPYRIAAAIAVMEMGIREYSVIAGAVGLTVEEVERVDMAEDASVKQLALAGIPLGESFKLDNRVRCPKCSAKVGIAPCIACRSH